jgi:hypothetical protein
VSDHVRVYAVANLHKGRIHGMTCNVNQAAAWVRELCDQYGPGAAVQCVDLVNPAEQDIPHAGRDEQETHRDDPLGIGWAGTSDHMPPA